jgi:hydrogenase/urease accessory protein HupE
VTISAGKRVHLFFITLCLLFITVQAHSHLLPVGGSRWCLGKSGVVATIDLSQNLISEIKGIKEGHFAFDTISDKQLQQIATEIIQPYMNKKLTLSVNGKSYPVKVDKLIRNENTTFAIWLSADNLGFNKPENVLTIDYRLLFEETSNGHMNMAYLYKSDATGSAINNLFDFTPPDAQNNFVSNSAAWELSVKGSGTGSAISPAVAAIQPILKKNHQNIAGQRVASASQAPVGESVIPVTGNVIKQVSAVQKAAPVLPDSIQNKQNPGDKGVIQPNDANDKQVSVGREKGNTGSEWSTVGDFILLGIEHILTGYDHIAFLIGLIVIGLSIREVLKIITAFTIAHSITLLLAALQIITLNSRFVESVIAFSICYIALENLFRKKVQYRWLITFCFGLVHGFGFASALQELIVGKSNLIISVLSFNFGVETGQLMIFFILLPVMYLLKQKMEFRRVTVGVSLAIFIFGFTWLVERLFDLKLLPI